MEDQLTEDDVCAVLEAERIDAMVRLHWYPDVPSALAGEAHYDDATLPLERARVRYRRGAQLLRRYALTRSPRFAATDSARALQERTRLSRKAYSLIIQVSANFPTPDLRARLVCLVPRSESP